MYINIWLLILFLLVLTVNYAFIISEIIKIKKCIPELQCADNGPVAPVEYMGGRGDVTVCHLRVIGDDTGIRGVWVNDVKVSGQTNAIGISRLVNNWYIAMNPTKPMVIERVVESWLLASIDLGISGSFGHGEYTYILTVNRKCG